MQKLPLTVLSGFSAVASSQLFALVGCRVAEIVWRGLRLAGRPRSRGAISAAGGSAPISDQAESSANTATTVRLIAVRSSRLQPSTAWITAERVRPFYLALYLFRKAEKE